jgi:hypothetical protein
MTRREMLQRLVEIQNQPVVCNQDILTITGFMSDAQVAQHLAYYETRTLEQMYAAPQRKAR